MGFKKIFALSIADYDRSPDSFVKNPYSPGFGPRSLTWVIFYFVNISARKKVRVYESYGRNEAEARKGLIAAKVVGANKLTTITEQKFKELKRKKR